MRKLVGTSLLLLTVSFWSAPLDANKNDDLLKAITYSQLSKVQAALAKGANPNAKDGAGVTALMKAALDRDATILKLLLAKGADPNLLRSDGIGALDMASANGLHDPTMALILAGANVNHADPQGRTALISAAETADVLAVEALLSRGANADASQQDGRTAADLARGGSGGPFSRCECAQERYRILRMLAGNDAVAAQVAFETLNGTVATLREALAKGADANATDRAGVTGLLYAAAMPGNVEAIKLLIEAGAKTSARLPNRKLRMSIDRSGKTFRIVDANWTPLMLACVNGDRDAVQALITGGADVNEQDTSGRTALSEATRLGHTAVAELLRAAGAK